LQIGIGVFADLMLRAGVLLLMPVYPDIDFVSVAVVFILGYTARLCQPRAGQSRRVRPAMLVDCRSSAASTWSRRSAVSRAVFVIPFMLAITNFGDARTLAQRGAAVARGARGGGRG